MTLHWWMHWFWVTAHIAVIQAAPLASTTQEPQIRVTDRKSSFQTLPRQLDVPSEQFHPPVEPSRQNSRVAKAIGVYPQPLTDALRQPPNSPFLAVENDHLISNTTDINNSDNNNGSSGFINRDSNVTNFNSNFNNRTIARSSSLKKNSKVTWIQTSNKTRTKFDNKSAEGFHNDENQSLAVLPLQDEAPRFKLVLNRNKSIPYGSVGLKLFNKSEDVEVDKELVEQRVLATAASILQGGIGESTRLSRARSAFSSDFQQEQQRQAQEQSEGNISSSNGTTSAVDIAAVTGSCLATVVLLSTMGSLGFVMYRRRYLNPPQTLNSDKCSNPDSSGYIDDSTIRDNSEEMYSLDNDSFLNSLEAMTIQNYWTDSVKHTKL